MAAVGLAWSVSRAALAEAAILDSLRGAALLSMLASTHSCGATRCSGSEAATRSGRSREPDTPRTDCLPEGGGLGNKWVYQTWGLGNEVLFPGFVALGLGLTGIVLGAASLVVRLRRRGEGKIETAGTPGAARRQGCTFELAGFYTVLGGLAFWLSFGPKAGLYTLFYPYVPAVTLLRAPARIGIVVTLSLSVLGGLALGCCGRRGVVRARWRCGLVEPRVLFTREALRLRCPALSVTPGPIQFRFRGETPRHCMLQRRGRSLVNG